MKVAGKAPLCAGLDGPSPRSGLHTGGCARPPRRLLAPSLSIFKTRCIYKFLVPVCWFLNFGVKQLLPRKLLPRKNLASRIDLPVFIALVLKIIWSSKYLPMCVYVHFAHQDKSCHQSKSNQSLKNNVRIVHQLLEFSNIINLCAFNCLQSWFFQNTKKYQCLMFHPL